MRRALILLAITSSLGITLASATIHPALRPMAERSLFFVEPGFPDLSATAMSIL